MYLIILLILGILMLDSFLKAATKKKEQKEKTSMYRCECGRPAVEFVPGTNRPVCERCSGEND